MILNDSLSAKKCRLEHGKMTQVIPVLSCLSYSADKLQHHFSSAVAVIYTLNYVFMSFMLHTRQASKKFTKSQHCHRSKIRNKRNEKKTKKCMSTCIEETKTDMI